VELAVQHADCSAVFDARSQLVVRDVFGSRLVLGTLASGATAVALVIAHYGDGICSVHEVRD